jgi:hypothetical protein
MNLDGRVAMMLNKLGKYYTFKIRGTPTVNDSFYKDETNTFTEVSVKAVVFPARAYDVHSHSLHLERSTGIEAVGIIDVFVDQTNCSIDVDDYIVIGTKEYKIKSKEIFGDAYYIFEAHLE